VTIAKQVKIIKKMKGVLTHTLIKGQECQKKSCWKIFNW